MKLEAVTISINYSDYLEKVVERNAALLDRWVVVVDPGDRATVELCRRHTNIQVVETTVAFEPGVHFPKGSMINEGLNALTTKDWVLLLDSDIELPRKLRSILTTARLDPECMYGAAYRLLAGDDHVIEGIHGQDFIRNLGFFQLFHWRRADQHPEESHDAGQDDMTFNRYWNTDEIKKIQDLTPIHFGPKTTHWLGRHRGDASPFSRLTEQQRWGRRIGLNGVTTAGT